MNKINYKVHIIKEDKAYFSKFKPLLFNEIIHKIKNSYDNFIINKKYFYKFEKYKISHTEFLDAYEKINLKLNEFDIFNIKNIENEFYLKLDKNTFLHVEEIEYEDEIFYFIENRINLKNNSFHIYYFEHLYLSDFIVSIYKHKNLIEIIDAKKTLSFLFYKYDLINFNTKSINDLKKINNLQIFYYKDFFILLTYKKFRSNLDVYLKLKNQNSEQASLFKNKIILNRNYLTESSFEDFINLETMDLLKILDY
jgi:hypothetical protein